jgi:hypothetical protein
MKRESYLFRMCMPVETTATTDVDVSGPPVGSNDIRFMRSYEDIASK